MASDISRSDKEESIRKVMNYKDGDYYVGGLATSKAISILGGVYGKDTVSGLLSNASNEAIDTVYDYLKSYIDHMKNKPQPKTISVDRSEYARLLINSERLQRLEAGGVDDWVWYGDSLNPDDEESMEDFEERIKNKVL